MCECFSNNHIYIQIGMIFGLITFSGIPLSLLSCLLSYAISYVNETNYQTPGWMQWLYREYSVDGVGIFMIGSLGALLMIIAWPGLAAYLTFFGLLRTLRFMMRIKKGIMKLVSNKKCLKDYTEKDKPKMRF